MIRFLALATLAAIVFSGSDCQAQQSRGLFFRKARSLGSVRSAYREFQSSRTYQVPSSKLARILDGPMTGKYRNPLEVESRYQGGFHHSYYDNLGIPSGDIGLRGNGINWNLW